MDAPTLQWLHHNILPMDVGKMRVLEVGSMNVNGSVRPHVESLEPREYVGVDIGPGAGVDRVVSAHGLLEAFGAEAFDVVISTEMLEHVQDWRDAVNQMKLVLRPGGLLVITTRRPGFPRHSYPHDHWRFTPKNLRAAMVDFWVKDCRAVIGKGVVIKAAKPYSWEAPAGLGHINPRPAPRRDLRWSAWKVWAFWAYRGRKPAAEDWCGTAGGPP